MRKSHTIKICEEGVVGLASARIERAHTSCACVYTIFTSSARIEHVPRYVCVHVCTCTIERGNRKNKCVHASERETERKSKNTCE